jgi:ABC-type transport system involved in cytochrome c biogenesis permease component
VFRFNQDLAGEYVTNVLELVDLVVNGGELGVFGRSVEAIGLVRARALVQEVQVTLRQEGNDAAAARLDPIVTFIDGAAANLDLARPAANAIRAPIELEVNEQARGSQPLSAFGFAGALVVSLGLAGALLAAAALSAERDENVLVRLRRGLVSAPALVGGKVALAAVACVVVGLTLLALVALLTALAVGRWALWLPVLLLAGAAFGAFGALIGAAARDSRTALLGTLMLSLPLVAVGLIPNSDPADVVAALVPFGPAFDSFQTLLVEPAIPTRLLLEMGHMALLALAFGAAASWVVSARPG